MRLTTADLPGFVAESDRRGGPGTPDCDAYWAGFGYVPDRVVDQTLDPFGDAYVAEQLALHAEMSGRVFDQQANERTSFDLEAHVAAANPYDHPAPGGLALHIERLSRAIRLAGPRRGGRLLDMGCGWGLSSEVAAYCGLDVTAIDINPAFVELVARRAARSGAAIAASEGAFDTFGSDDRYAMILFYECLHHAVRPWEVLSRMARHLEPGGRVVLAGEPINAVWWRHWGLRLDALSVYCIHKFGWFESGWSADFLTACCARAGLQVRIVEDADPQIGATVVASRPTLGRLSAAEIARGAAVRGWCVEADHLVSLGDDGLALAFPPGSAAVMLGFDNFRGRPLRLRIAAAGRTLVDRDMPPGRTDIRIDRASAAPGLTIAGDLWTPHDELGNGDTRRIGLHLADATFV